MPLIYVTGISGAGKTSVLGELRDRGYESYGVDEDGFGRWLDPRSGEVVTFPVDDEAVDRHEWYADHVWALDVDKIAELKRHSDRCAAPVFLCGVAAGDREAWPYFDVVCALVIDEATIITASPNARTVGTANEQTNSPKSWSGMSVTRRRIGGSAR
jgi:hypothetical protein